MVAPVEGVQPLLLLWWRGTMIGTATREVGATQKIMADPASRTARSAELSTTGCRRRRRMLVIGCRRRFSGILGADAAPSRRARAPPRPTSGVGAADGHQLDLPRLAPPRPQRAQRGSPAASINLMPAIVRLLRSSFACAHFPAHQKPQATGSKACPRIGMAFLPRCRKGSSAHLAD